MTNPRLDKQQLAQAHKLLKKIRTQLESLSGGDDGLLFAFRRKLYKQLVYDERNTPTHRSKIKALKRKQQNNRCAECGELLPEKYCVLDRLDAPQGYSVENTRLVHQQCDIQKQAAKGYT